MDLERKPFQGVLNIICFNRHFYLTAGLLLIVLLLSKSLFPQVIPNLVFIGAALTGLSITVSLLVSFYVYDLSDLYNLNWLDSSACNYKNKILNINAGFDETSEIIMSKFTDSELTICDFYNPAQHTEVSIKRARQAYPPNSKTVSIKTDRLPFPENTFDKTMAFLSVHEIRNCKEKTSFFKELNRVTKSSGQIFVTEHLRDFNNFLAYTVGFFHFHTRKSWLHVFERASLTIKEEIKTTPFITTFILEKNGDTS